MGQNLGKKSFESNVKISNEDIDLDNESAEVYEYKTNHHDLDFDNDLDKDLDKDLEIVFENEDNTELYHKNLDNDSHSGPENFKRSRPKKLVKSNKSISRNFFSPNSIFCNFKNGQKSIFELGKSF